MDRCPSCRSDDRKIHGIIYEGGYANRRCDDEWHVSVDLKLTPEDEKLLADMKISTR